jgi:hypothetical protein
MLWVAKIDSWDSATGVGQAKPNSPSRREVCAFSSILNLKQNFTTLCLNKAKLLKAQRSPGGWDNKATVQGIAEPKPANTPSGATGRKAAGVRAAASKGVGTPAQYKANGPGSTIRRKVGTAGGGAAAAALAETKATRREGSGKNEGAGSKNSPAGRGGDTHRADIATPQSGAASMGAHASDDDVRSSPKRKPKGRSAQKNKKRDDEIMAAMPGTEQVTK